MACKLLVFLVLVCAIVNLCDANLNKVYKEVNKFLTEMGPGKERAVYLVKAEADLEKLKTSIIARVTKRSLIEGLNKLLRIGRLIIKQDCNHDEYLFLKELEEYSQGTQYISAEDRPKFSIFDLIVNEMSVKHAENCRSKHVDTFFAIYPKVEHRSLAEFKNDRFNQMESAYGTLQEYLEALIKYTFLYDEDLQDDAYNHIKRSSHEMDRRDFSKMFNKYLYMPCQEYIAKLKLLIGARFDAKVLPGLTGFDLSDARLVPFYKALASHNACTYVLFTGDKLKQRLKTKWEEDPEK